MWSLMQKPSVSYRKCIAKNEGKIDLELIKNQVQVSYRQCIAKNERKIWCEIYVYNEIYCSTYLFW